MRSLMTLSPLTRTTGFNRELDRFFEDFFVPARGDTWTPAADIIEEKDHYLVRMDLPGLKRDEISVSIGDGHLIVRGSRKVEKSEEKDNLIRHERRSGEFTRSFRLGDLISTDNVSAEYRDGVLEVKVPKAEEALPRQIEVK